MNLRDVYSIRVPRTERRRVGRGWGSGIGKTSGRGEKGAGRRSGTKFRLRFEGGQMPLYRRLPKRGFTNPFKVTAEPVNLAKLKLLAGTDVTPETLHAAGLISRADTAVKLLGSGDADRAYAVKGMPVSASAKAKIEAAGGRIED
jgi:large subunit ribosomal protein L15